MNAEIALGTFQYRDYFPESKKVTLFEQLQRDKYPDHLYPFFNDFAQQWYDRQKGNWKPSYQRTVKNTLDRYLIPHFGNTLVSEVTLAQVEYFRQSLQAARKPNGAPTLTNKRINGILWPLIAIISLAAEEHHFPYPFRRYRSLKEEKANSQPLTLEEVKQFLESCDPQWQDYFLLRFWTGMRSCEVHGLYWDHIDFKHRLIRVRQNYVNGEICDVKTPKSRRELVMCDTLYAALQRQWQQRDPSSPFVFSGKNGRGLDTHYISTRVWHPTLKKAGLAPRRAYETRHTAAVLHIAAHENPLYISHMLGHSDTKLLFDVYAPYVANASRQDGRAFSTMMQGGAA